MDYLRGYTSQRTKRLFEEKRRRDFEHCDDRKRSIILKNPLPFLLGIYKLEREVSFFGLTIPTKALCWI